MKIEPIPKRSDGFDLSFLTDPILDNLILLIRFLIRFGSAFYLTNSVANLAMILKRLVVSVEDRDGWVGGSRGDIVPK